MKTTWVVLIAGACSQLISSAETREMDAFVLKTGQPTEHLAVTVSNRGSSMSSGGRKFELRESVYEFPCLEPRGDPEQTCYWSGIVRDSWECCGTRRAR